MTPEEARSLETRAIRAIHDSESRADVIPPYTECVRKREFISLDKVEAAIVERWSETVLEWAQIKARETIENELEHARTGDDGE